MDTATASGLQVAFEDGLGQRRQIVGASNQPLTLLVFDNDLAGLPSFEVLLRERIDQLAGFHHPSYARVRGIAHLARVPSSLALASDQVAGARLSEVLTVAEQHLIPLEIEAAYCLIRQLVPAVAALQERLPHGFHGALAPERLIITPDGRLVIVEHVLATGLEQLHFSRERYWNQLRIALPANAAGPQFDRRADVVQIGAFALALILGRPLADHEFPDSTENLVDGVRAISATGLELLPAGVHLWLRRALQLEGDRSFATAIDAHAELDRVIAADDTRYRRALESFLSQCYEALPQHEVKAPRAIATASPIRMAPTTRPSAIADDDDLDSTGAERPMPAPASAIRTSSSLHVGGSLFLKNEMSSDQHEAPSPIELSLPVSSPTVVHPTPVAAPTSGLFIARPVEAESDSSRFFGPQIIAGPTERALHTPPVAAHFGTETSARTSLNDQRTDARAAAAPANPPAPPRNIAFAPAWRQDDDESAETGSEPIEEQQHPTTWGRNRLIVAAVVLIALASAATLGARRFLSAEATGTLIVNTNPPGVSVVVDGQRHGTTPATVELTPGDHVLTLASADQSRTIPVSITQGGQVSQFIEFPAIVTAAVVGKLQIRTEPPGASVVVDGQSRGVSPLTVEGLAPGAHVVRLENAMGSVTEQVTVEAGATASLVVPLGAPAGALVSGWISIVAPADVQVYEDKRLIGSSRTDRIMMPVGRHELEIVNEALDYRATRVVQVTPGSTSSVRLDWPKGSMALNAQPWAEVWLDGQALGDTPIGNVQVPVGTHEVVFRHPELGEQKHTVTVTVSRPARVSADLRTR